MPPVNPECRVPPPLAGEHPVPVYVVSHEDRDDEISLVDLWHVIVARRRLILWSLLAAIVLAITYVLVTGPLYQAEADLLPPQQQDIQGLMINYQDKVELKAERYTPDSVYKRFLTKLKSKGVRREFFDTYNLADYYLANESHTDADVERVFNRVFNERLQVQADKQDTSFVVVRLEDSDPEVAARRLNQFIAFSNERTVNQLLAEANAAIRQEIESLRGQLARKLIVAAQKRRDTITTLKEALHIARTLGVEGVSNLAVKVEGDEVVIDPNVTRMPLYMRGAKALEVEISVLESRESDEPYIAGLRELQERLRFLEDISIDSEKLSAVTIDAAAGAPYQVEELRKNSIFVLAAVFGLMAGIFLAFIVEFRSRVRGQPEQKPLR